MHPQPLRRRNKQYEDEPEQVDITLGSYTSYVEVPQKDVPKKSRQIGFIRNEDKKRVRKGKKRL